MPIGADVTVPAPVPAGVTVNVGVSSVNVAVTDRAWVIETVHVLVPLHAPDQPANVEPGLASAVSDTDVPWA